MLQYVMLCCGINLPVVVRVLSCPALFACPGNVVANGVPRAPRSKLSLTRLRHPIDAIGVHDHERMGRA